MRCLVRSALWLMCAALLASAVPHRMRAAAEVVEIIEPGGDAARYWPRWRGPSGQGIVRVGAYRDRWSARDGVAWKVAVPGRGNSSPIVWDDRIFVTTAYDGGRRLSLVAFRRRDGVRLWETFTPQSGVERAHPKNGHASATPVTDGQRVYASFGAQGLLATDLDGKLLWHAPVGRLDNYHGSAGSPVLYKDLVIIYQDAGSGSFVAAFDAQTGKVRWRAERSETVG